MSTVLPIGYLTVLQAAAMISSALHAGVADLPVVTRLRKKGLDVRDGKAMDQAIAELWKGVDEGRLRAMALGGRPRRIVRLDANLTKSIPSLRSPRGRGFTLLRQSNPAYHQLASWFGSSLHTAIPAFRETELHKLARILMRKRRIAKKPAGQNKLAGRPSILAAVQLVIRDVVVQRKWNPAMSMKALTRQVNRAGKWGKDISQTTVTRALDHLFEDTRDRQFERVRHPRKPRR